MRKVFLTVCMFLGSITGVISMNLESLSAVNKLREDYALGQSGTAMPLYKIVKPLLSEKEDDYLTAKLTYVELVFSGIRENSEEINSAIDIYLKLLGSQSKKFFNPLSSERIEFHDQSLRTALLLKSHELRIAIQEKQTKEHQLTDELRELLFKVFTGEISDSSSLSGEVIEEEIEYVAMS